MMCLEMYERAGDFFDQMDLQERALEAVPIPIPLYPIETTCVLYSMFCIVLVLVCYILYWIMKCDAIRSHISAVCERTCIQTRC